MKKLILLLQFLTIYSKKFVERVEITTQISKAPQHFPYVLKRKPRSLHVFTFETSEQENKYIHLILTLEDSNKVKKNPLHLIQWTRIKNQELKADSIVAHTVALENSGEQEYLLEGEKYFLNFYRDNEINGFVIVVNAECLRRKRKIWYEFASTIRFENFMLYKEYCFFLDKQKRSLRISFETITPKNQHLLFESEIIFKNCCVGSYEVVNVSALITDSPDKQSHCWLGQDCIEYKIKTLVSTEKLKIEYRLGTDTLEVIAPLSTLRLIKTPRMNVGLNTSGTTVSLNEVQLIEQTDALNQLKQAIHIETENAIKAEMDGVVEITFCLKNTKKDGLRKIFFNLPKYRFLAERNNFYKIEVVIFVTVEYENEISNYLWNRPVFVKTSSENHIKFFTVEMHKLFLKLMVPLEMQEGSDGKWALTYNPQNIRILYPWNTVRSKKVGHPKFY